MDSNSKGKKAGKSGMKEQRSWGSELLEDLGEQPSFRRQDEI